MQLLKVAFDPRTDAATHTNREAAMAERPCFADVPRYARLKARHRVPLNVAPGVALGPVRIVTYADQRFRL